MKMKIQTYLKKLKGCVAEGNPHHTLFTSNVNSNAVL